MNNTQVLSVSIVLANLYFKYGELPLRIYSKNRGAIENSINPTKTIQDMVAEVIG